MSMLGKATVSHASDVEEISDARVDSMLEGGLSPIERDLAALNFEFLRLVREAAAADPTGTAIRFGLEEGIIKLVAASSICDLRAMAEAGIALFRVVPSSETAWCAIARGKCDPAMAIAHGPSSRRRVA